MLEQASCIIHLCSLHNDMAHISKSVPFELNWNKASEKAQSSFLPWDLTTGLSGDANSFSQECVSLLPNFGHCKSMILI